MDNNDIRVARNVESIAVSNLVTISVKKVVEEEMVGIRRMQNSTLLIKKSTELRQGSGAKKRSKKNPVPCMKQRRLLRKWKPRLEEELSSATAVRSGGQAEGVYV